VAVTPAAGWVNQTGAFFIGLLAGPWCYLCADCKRRTGLDDALDAFGVHATGGVLGGLLTGFFADPTFYGPYASPSVQYYPGVFYAVGHPDQATQLGAQAYGCFATVLYSTVVTYVLLLLVDVTLGLRMPDELLTHDLDSPLYDNE
jgi:Amt family ammonium transporter